MTDRYELTFGCGWHTGEITVNDHEWPGRRLRTSWNKITVEVSRATYLDWYYRVTGQQPPAPDVTVDPEYDDDYWWVSDYDTGKSILHEHTAGRKYPIYGRITMYVSGCIHRGWYLT